MQIWFAVLYLLRTQIHESMHALMYTLSGGSGIVISIWLDGRGLTEAQATRQPRPGDDVPKERERVNYRQLVCTPAGHLGAGVAGALLIFAGFDILAVSALNR